MTNSPNVDTELQRWLGGIPYEVAFWRSYYANRKRRADLFRWSCFDKPFELEDFDIHRFVRELPSEEPVILDVGSSLSYMMGNIIDGKPRTITYVDPLAPFYNDILRRYDIPRPQIQFGMIETLSVSFPAQSADFIHVRNALDHCANPLQGIMQCLEILKVGGILYLNHHPDEAIRENYRGFHQYNIIDRQGDLVIWNRDESHSLANLLGDFASMRVGRSDKGNVVAVITKTAPLPASLTLSDDARRRFSSLLANVLLYFSSSSNSLSFQFKRLYSTAAHRLMRLLPYSLLHKVKRIFTASK